MKKNVMVVVIVLVIIAASLMYFFQSRNTVEQDGANLPDDIANAPPEKSEELYDLKSSIGSVIDDSVQEEIQKVVEDEVLKTTEPKKYATFCC